MQPKIKSFSLWIIGLSGSGKTTLSNELFRIFQENGQFIKLLDGDQLRKGINNNLGFSETDRLENIRRAAEISKLFLESGISTINAFICPTHETQALARNIIGNENYIEVYLNTPMNICETRDVKGLYAKARNGEIPQFTGISSPFEAPIKPNLTLNTSNINPFDLAHQIVKYVTEQHPTTSNQ